MRLSPAQLGCADCATLYRATSSLVPGRCHQRASPEARRPQCAAKWCCWASAQAARRWLLRSPASSAYAFHFLCALFSFGREAFVGACIYSGACEINARHCSRPSWKLLLRRICVCCVQTRALPPPPPHTMLVLSTSWVRWLCEINARFSLEPHQHFPPHFSSTPDGARSAHQHCMGGGGGGGLQRNG